MILQACTMARAPLRRGRCASRGIALAPPAALPPCTPSTSGFANPPSTSPPDPRFLYLNDCYQEALAALGYGIEARKGFISLIGDAGTGKTTLLRRLLDTVGPATKTVLLLNPTVSFDEILEHTLLELGVPPEGGRKLVLLQRLNEFLLEHTQAGGNVALLIDEAQDLRPDVLEELRLLSNLETAREKILQ